MHRMFGLDLTLLERRGNRLWRRRMHIRKFAETETDISILGLWQNLIHKIKFFKNPVYF